jgi:hypothetical protein
MDDPFHHYTLTPSRLEERRGWELRQGLVEISELILVIAIEKYKPGFIACFRQVARKLLAQLCTV